ncbi:hypothetical protein I8748_01460 [Nostoc sp. CENA67]|uniref:Uncharacterized protein n=1 Tax=Amazonocrinis nigriterrae CENA67 TaxID=2794033 RepID=A0A8J7L632_9NOST|nr:alr0857 family protein [Amazonocrinis nigriterrae]MBH8560858.1 hypothetical protein [Amazonocrinis nigriterrae CENA67]
MLKLTYTEESFYLECLTQPLEDWVAQRVIFALRVGQSLCVEPSTASFLLPVDLPGVDLLKAEVKRDDSEIIDLCACDSECMEVTLRGSWLSDGSEDAMGVFATSMSDRAEFLLQKLWQEAQACASVMSE